MKTPICILAVSAIGALAVPAAGAMIPGDARSGYGNGATPQQLVKHVTQTPTKQGIRYDQQAYVPGGSSPAVSKAIVSQGKRGLR